VVFHIGKHHFIVAYHIRIHSLIHHVVLQIIGKRIVIIDDKNSQIVRVKCVNLHKVNQSIHGWCSVPKECREDLLEGLQITLPMKKAISIPGAPAPIGPYSQAILKNDTLYVSGQIPLNPFTNELVLDSIEAATTQVLKNIE